MKTLNLKFTALVAIAVLLGTVFFTSCSKNEVYESQNVTEVSPELRQKISHYTIQTCELKEGDVVKTGVMCGSGSSDDCWRLIECKESGGVLDKYYTKDELKEMIENPRPLKPEAIRELKEKQILPIK